MTTGTIAPVSVDKALSVQINPNTPSLTTLVVMGILMAVFHGKEKSKVGTNTGTIIHWARELPTNDRRSNT